MYRILTFCILFSIWIVFSGLFDAFHLPLGVLSAGLVTWASSDLLFPNRAPGLAARIKECSRLMSYVPWLLYQILLANLHVMYLALHPHGFAHVQPEIIRIRTKLRSDFAKWLLANSITLTPGTVTVKVEGDYLHVHAISRQAARGLGKEMEQRITRIFESENKR